MNQEILRQRVAALQERWGTTNKFICKVADIDTSSFCHFRLGKRLLSCDAVSRLDKFLLEREF